MKDKIQIALLSVIAVALVALAIAQFTGDGSSSPKSNVVASSNVVANQAPSTTSPVFDPMANTGEVVDNTPKTIMSFSKSEHDFGNIKQDTENKHKFTFTNTGNEPLLIESATGSCGCTVPQYPKQPIPPGGTGEIEVEYKPGKQENAQTKTVTIVANTEPRETILRLKAFVQKEG
jgi:hypothetical protein